MTEYWISKKQYWCKYCSIWIKDDAPSRRQHETGLRHIGAKERFIRDLYKSGSMAKRDKEQEAQEMARIEAAAEAAHAQDTGTAGPSRKSILYAQNHKGPSSAVSRPSKSGDKFANYSTASQLGLVDDETPQPTTFEIEQMLKNKETKVGQWEAVVAEPTGLDSNSVGYRGKAEHGADGEEETEGWKFGYKGKRPIRDPYDDDDFDPSTILKMRKKVKQDQNGEEAPTAPPAAAAAAVLIPTSEELGNREGALDREGWSGKIELTPGAVTEKKDGGGWVKLENTSGGTFGEFTDVHEAEGGTTIAPEEAETKPDFGVASTQDTKPTIPEVDAPVQGSAGGTEVASGGLFKKRRPPPSSRKK